MNLRITHFLLVMVSVFSGHAQKEPIKGEVSFLTTQNVYVRFEDTGDMKVGDSIYISNKDSACLIITQKSSTSCVCSLINACPVERGTQVIYFPQTTEVVEPIVEVEKPLPESSEEEEVKIDPMRLQEIRARVSASTYSTLASEREDRHRLMTRLSVNADHIENSGFSFDLNMNYRHILDEGNSTSLTSNDLLRIYGAAVTYEATPTLTAVLGRSINPKISSLGPIDGVQAEKTFNNHYVGALVGFRPDIFDFGFNPDLLEYGAYYGYQTQAEDFRSQTTIGGIEQRGGSDIDRRYAYLQHSSTVYKDLSFFASAEMDLYSKVNSVTNFEPRLTNLYASGRYRFSREVNLMLSYDSRKRIIYYDTYRSDLDRLLDDDLARQGLRARLNVRPGRYIFTGLSYSRRFQSDSQNKSDNYYGYVTLSRTPYIDGRTTITLNRNESNYLISNIASLRHSRNYFNNRLTTDFYYRFVYSDYESMSDNLLQHFAGADLSYYINRDLYVSLTGEFSMYEDQQNYRIYTRIVQRFHSKRKRR